ncbi:MAG: hypothetical protein EPN60_03415 [Nevskiaceae bacterium]|nr:MAG: hypothetical protein EPO48_09845 [Nevskiaceae bacterium]TAM32748.1 MAG: hypothetical protein EPN60_03415 [Nevskiaceae bacterium]
MHSKNIGLPCAALALLLAACGGGDGGYCTGSFQGGDHNVVCTNCSWDRPEAAIDNDPGSYASLIIGSGGGAVTLRGYAPEGLSFPANVDAGALMRFPPGNFVNTSVRFNSYNGNLPVDVLSGGGMAGYGEIPGAGSESYYQMFPLAGFDSLEAVITLSGNSEPVEVRVYELCGDR